MESTARKEECIESLKQRIRSLVPIGKDDLNAIVNQFEYRSFPKGKVLLKEESRGDFWGFVHSGLVRIYSYNSKGEDCTNWFMQEGDFITEYVSFLTQAPSPESFAALEDTELMVVDAAALQNLLDRFPLFDRFARLLYQQTIITIKKNMKAKLHVDAQGRYTSFLQMRSELMKRVPLKFIASYLNINESTLSRVRRKMMNAE